MAAIPHGFVLKQQNHIKHWPIFTAYAYVLDITQEMHILKPKPIFQYLSTSFNFSTSSTYPLPALLRPSPWSFLLALFAGLQWPCPPPLLFPYGSNQVGVGDSWHKVTIQWWHFRNHWNINLIWKNELKTSNLMPHFRNKILPSLKLTYHLKVGLPTKFQGG